MYQSTPDPTGKSFGNSEFSKEISKFGQGLFQLGFEFGTPDQFVQ